jgi:hypothetical protein
MCHQKTIAFNKRRKILLFDGGKKLTGPRKIKNGNRTSRKYFEWIFVAAFSNGDGFVLSAHTLRKPTPFVECAHATATPLEMVERKKLIIVKRGDGDLELNIIKKVFT